MACTVGKMWEFSVVRSLGLLLRTLPFLVARAAVQCGIAAAILLAAFVGAVAARRVEEPLSAILPGSVAVWGGLAGVLVAVALAHARRDWLLYRITTPHIALMVELLDRRPIPLLGGQIAHGRAVVSARFGDAPALFALNRLIRGVIRTATRMVDGLLVDIVPSFGLDRLLRAAGLHLRLVSGLVDPMILSHALRERSENAWEAAHDGLVLYTQNARTILVNAIWLSLAGWAVAVSAAIAVLASQAFTDLLPQGSWVLPLVLAALAWTIKSSLWDPFALACLLQLNRRLAEEQEPLPEWRGRLTQVSETFRQLGERALGWSARGMQDI